MACRVSIGAYAIALADNPAMKPMTIWLVGVP